MKNRVLAAGILAVILVVVFDLRERARKAISSVGRTAAPNHASSRPGEISQVPLPFPATAATVPPRETASASSDLIHAQETTFKSWLREWREGRTDLAKGRELASLRREQMLKTFLENPAGAYAESLSWSEWGAVPEELKDLVEKPFSAVVDFSVLPNCPSSDALLPKIHPHRVLLEGEWHEAYVYGAKKTLSSKEGMPVRGILLAGKVLLAEGAFEQLNAADLAVVEELFPQKRDGAGLKIDRSENTNLLLGGEIYSVSLEEKEALTDVFASAAKSFNPQSMLTALGVAATGTNVAGLKVASDGILRASSVWTETPKTTLAVRISYADAASTYSYTLTEMTNLMRNASNAVKVMSYGKTHLVPRVASVTLPKTKQAYQDGGPDLIVMDTRTALSAIGISASSYSFIIHAHPGMNFGYAGLGQIGAGISWLNGNVSLEVTVHELGHNYGLGHAHFWAGVTGNGSLGRRQADGSSMEHEEYGDPFDIMGGSTLPAGQYNAHGKMALNWIEQKEVITAVTNGIYRIYRYDHQSARTNAGTKLALRVPAPSGETYVVSHRRLFATNPSLFRGANIVRVDGPGDQSLIDTTPLSRAVTALTNDKNDAGLAVGKTFTDPLGTLRITTIASAGTAPQEYIDVQVTFAEAGAFSFYTASDFSTNGLVGSYVNRSLRTRPTQDDWRSAVGVTVSGRRVDTTLNFTSDGWGARAILGLTGGTDANWENFSVQWDGVVVVRRAVRLATTSDDSSRFWIDLNGNGSFGTTAPEFVNNHWGSGQGPTLGDISTRIGPGVYRIRIQYEEENGGNYFAIGSADFPFELFTDAAGTEPGLVGSYVGRSLRSATAQVDWRVAQTIAGTRTDAYPGFTVNGWGSLSDVGLFNGVNGADSDWDNFSVQWDGYLKVSVPLKMATISDDHSRMWIDLNTNGAFATTAPEFLNNGWGGGGQGVTIGQLSTVIQPGYYPIRIQYEEGGGGNYFLLAGVPQAPADAPVLVSNMVFDDPADSLVISGTNLNDFTIQFWMRSTQVAGEEERWTDGMTLVDVDIIPVPVDFGVSLGNGKVLFGLGDGVTPEVTLRSGFVADGAWHHVSARRVHASGEMTLFVDGLEMGRAFGLTEDLNGTTVYNVGGTIQFPQNFIGTLDQMRVWNVARTDQQIAADYHATRNTHGFIDEAPLVRITPLVNSVQVYWDALSRYRILEGSATADGAYVLLPTDQNSTNITAGAGTRFFRVRR